jgi:putative redox protein
MVGTFPAAKLETMSMTATARRIGTTLGQEVDVNGRHTIITDEPLSLGGGDTGPAPHELLAATLASCVATMIALYARNRNWELGETEVFVDYEPDVVPRRLNVELRLAPGLTEEQIRRLERVAQTCPVRRAMEAGFSFQERVVESQPRAEAA